MSNSPLILAIESSCDDTSAAVMSGKSVLSNIVAGQAVHEKFGGVVPELASRAHQSNIVPVVSEALKQAGVNASQLDAIAFTQGPGLMGSLHVGTAFAKSMSMTLNKPLIGVNHMEAHVMAHFIENGPNPVVPQTPFLCLTVSGGHTQLVSVDDQYHLSIIGQTLDDAAGEAFDKSAKVLGLPYPGGPQVDKLAKLGDPKRFKFAVPQLNEYQFSFSGLKTSLLYFLQKEVALDPDFIHKNLNDICASFQNTIISYLLKVTEKAAIEKSFNQLGLAGGVSANSELRIRFEEMCEKNKWRSFIPPFEYCTDNAAMIGISAFYKWEKKEFLTLHAAPLTRLNIDLAL